MTFDKIYQYNFPTIIRFGIGSSKELGDYLIKNNLLRPLIVTDPNVSQLGFFKGLIGDIKKKNISTEVFYDIHKNPVKSDVYKGTDVFDNTNRDSIIGIGGGAALDVARAIVLRINHREDLFKYDDLVGGDIYVTNDVPHFITILLRSRLQRVQAVKWDAVLLLPMMKRTRRKFFFHQNCLPK
jgi:alcohol dehydrogenase class IV